MMGSLDDSTIEMLEMFTSMTDPLIEELKLACESKDWHQFSELGHSLKGSSRSIGAVHLGEVCSSIQDESAEADDNARQSMVDNALIAYRDVKKAIEYFKTNGFK